MFNMLRYTSAATEWNEALPIGNGRLGAMVYGGVHAEKLRLNEESVWYGGSVDRTPKDAYLHLPKLRELIRNGDHTTAEALIRQRFFATPQSARHYEPLGTCTIEFDHGTGKREHSSYERKLDLDSACTTVEYATNGVNVRRETFASFPQNVIAIHVKSDKAISFVVHLTRMSDVEYEENEFLDSVGVKDCNIIMHVTPGGKNSNSTCCVANVRSEDPKGKVETVGRDLMVTSREALILITACTTYNEANPQAAALATIQNASKMSYEQLKSNHLHDWRSVYGCMSLLLGPECVEKPTDELIQNSHRDSALAALYLNFGRYLLLSSSRNYPKALPATLQGIWNPSFHPAWGSKYTININLQMNYWLAHTCNLSDCEIPMFNLLHRMAENGKKTAKMMYNCRGWCCHHNTDIWADTDPQDHCLTSTLWPLGGAWLCMHIWEHYSFNYDEKFLRWMLPVLEGCVLFLLDFLIPDKSGKYLITNPSMSPENTFVNEDGSNGVMCENSTIDTQIIRTVLMDYLSALKELKINNVDTIASVVKTLTRLPPIQISPRSHAIQEWGFIDPGEFEPGHRHVSHLIGIYPGKLITPVSNPDLAAAAEETLQRRLSHGGGHTGWSRAWLIGLYARLRKPEEVYKNVVALLRDSTLPNMLDTHPPFQIDGNFGGAAGITEALVQSHEEVETADNEQPNKQTKPTLIRLLPACPAEWKKGKLRGVKARGGFELDFEWDQGEVKYPIIVRSRLGRDALVVVHKAGSTAQDQGVRISVQGVGQHSVSPQA